MKRILWTALLALPFLAQPAQAQININHSCHGPGIPPISICLKNPCLDFNLFAGGGRTQLGPWYQYWPYEAHFQSSAPMGPMGGSNVMTLPPGFGQGVTYGAPQPISAPYSMPQQVQAPYAVPQYAQSPYGAPQYAQMPYVGPQYAQSPNVAPPYAPMPYGVPQYAQAPYGVPQFTQSAYGPSQYAQPPSSAPRSMPMAAPQQPTTHQPVGYTYPGTVPSYWYGK